MKFTKAISLITLSSLMSLSVQAAPNKDYANIKAILSYAPVAILLVPQKLVTGVRRLGGTQAKLSDGSIKNVRSYAISYIKQDNASCSLPVSITEVVSSSGVSVVGKPVLGASTCIMSATATKDLFN